MEDDLEIVLLKKIKPIIDDTTEKYMSITIDKLSDDITSKLRNTPLIDIEVNVTGYKVAKNNFKKAFLRKLLLLHYGNISEVARVTGKNRRSIHRLIKRFGINVKRIKKELIRPYDIKLSNVSSTISNVLNNYKRVIHPSRLEDMYNSMGAISENILKELPEPMLSFKQAQIEFEKRFFSKALKENKYNLSKTSKKIGLRQETLNRKLRALKII